MKSCFESYLIFFVCVEVLFNPTQSLCLNDKRRSSYKREIFAENSAVAGDAVLLLSEYSYKWSSLQIRGQMLGRRQRDKEMWM